MPQHAFSGLLASLNGYTQDTRLLRLTTPLGEQLLAECVRGEEGISQGFSFRIDALCEDAQLALKTLLGQPALLQVLTAGGRNALRPFHGHITSAQISGANGGLARYHLTLQPWSAFLGIGRDSRIFQDMTVFDILDTVFASYQGRGRLMPAWRYEIANRRIYPQRSLTTQYQESDLAFVERLMYEEGLFYFFEHAGDTGNASLGSHTMVVADHNGAFQPNALASVRFTQPGAVMREDSIDRWRTESRLRTDAVEMGSWDYRTTGQRQVSAAGVGGDASLVSRDAPGVYAWADREQGQRIVTRQIEALEATHQVHIGAGTVRTLAPGTTFALHGHARFDEGGGDVERRFTVTRVVHLMHNNLSAEVRGSVHALLGSGALAVALEAEPGMRFVGEGIAERPVYRNRFDALRADVPYRSSGVDGHGQLLHPRPTVRGQQTAIVVGPSGAMVHTDRDHRIKVQFHWQRGDASHSRMAHPFPDRHAGAPGNDRAGTWVRVATPLAGANWGSNMVPRVGQEVLVDFMEGDIDRPVVIGCLYNGRGQMDAQHAQAAYGAGAATGNAPPWFPGEGGGHAHPAVLSGFRSQALRQSQGGAAAYNQLVFDDSAEQARVVLQRRGQAHDGSAELNLGHLRHQSDNARLGAAGFGAELKTAHSVALRAGRGMLLTCDGRSGGSGSQLDSREAQAQIEASNQLQIGLATQAQKHNAKMKGEADAAELPVLKELDHSLEVLASMAADDVGYGKVFAYSEPYLQLSSSAGITVNTPYHAVMASGTTASMSAGQDINLAAQGNASTDVVGGISLFTYGKARNKTKASQETGLKLHAASGKLSSQSQSGKTSVVADKTITVASVAGTAVVSAPKKHVLLTAQGAYIKLEGGNIEVHAPGKVDFKTSKKELAGPASISSIQIAMKVAELNMKRDLEIEYIDADGNVLSDEPVLFKFFDGSEKTSILDSSGKAIIKQAPLGPFGAKQPRRR